MCVCVWQKGELALGGGPDFAVCVGIRHLEQSGLLGACEHYCNLNVNWNPDLTEVINRGVCAIPHWLQYQLVMGQRWTCGRAHQYTEGASHGYNHFSSLSYSLMSVFLSFLFFWFVIFLRLERLYVKTMSHSQCLKLTFDFWPMGLVNEKIHWPK